MLVRTAFLCSGYQCVRRGSGDGDDGSSGGSGARVFLLEFYIFVIFFLFTCGRLKRPLVVLAACKNTDFHIPFHACGCSNRMRKSVSPVCKNVLCSSDGLPSGTYKIKTHPHNISQMVV